MRREAPRKLASALLWLFLAASEIGFTATGDAALNNGGPDTRVGRVVAVDSVALSVGDMERAVAFYSRVLTFEKIDDREVAGKEYDHLFGLSGARIRSVRMRLDEEQIELMAFLAPRGRPVPGDSRSNDHWFQHIAIVVSDMDAAYARLQSFRVEHASTEPQRLPDWNPNASGIRAFYFRDPDEHNLEIIQFPAGKGLSKWHVRDNRVFLGIDHTAIVVADTAASLHFYRDTLGFRVAGESENWGPEQEHLNNVSGAHLRITSLRAPQGGPGVEFLEYLAPRTGRVFPADSRPNDLWYWQINMRSAEPREALVAHDPDGHASLIATPRNHAP